MNEDSAEKSDRPPVTPRLDKAVQESIGRKLRSAYNQIAEKPAYLGDPVLPPEMEDQITRLGTKLRANEEGVAAVANALDAPVQTSKEQATQNVEGTASATETSDAPPENDDRQEEPGQG